MDKIKDFLKLTLKPINMSNISFVIITLIGIFLISYYFAIPWSILIFSYYIIKNINLISDQYKLFSLAPIILNIVAIVFLCINVRPLIKKMSALILICTISAFVVLVSEKIERKNNFLLILGDTMGKMLLKIFSFINFKNIFKNDGEDKEDIEKRKIIGTWLWFILTSIYASHVMETKINY